MPHYRITVMLTSGKIFEGIRYSDIADIEQFYLLSSRVAERVFQQREICGFRVVMLCSKDPDIWPMIQRGQLSKALIPGR